MEQLYAAKVGQSNILNNISWSVLNILCATAKEEPFHIYLIHPNCPEECFSIPTPHEDVITVVEWSNTGNHLLTADENKLLAIWKVEVPPFCSNLTQ
jgi:WD40 repeat protein